MVRKTAQRIVGTTIVLFACYAAWFVNVDARTAAGPRIAGRTSSAYGGVLRLVLPQFFGQQVWTVFTSDTVVAALSPATFPTDARDPAVYRDLVDLDGDEYIIFEQPVLIPFLSITGDFARPNIALLFRQPVRVPPIRFGVDRGGRLGFSRRQSRSPQGAWLDGVLLRAEDPRTAIEALERNGVQRTDDPNRWVLDHRTPRTTHEGSPSSRRNAGATNGGPGSASRCRSRWC